MVPMLARFPEASIRLVPAPVPVLMPVVPFKVVPVIVPPPVILFDPMAMLPPMVKPVKVPTLVKEDPVTPELRVLPVKVPAGAMTVEVETPVTRPWASVVMEGTTEAEP